MASEAGWIDKNNNNKRSKNIHQKSKTVIKGKYMNCDKELNLIHSKAQAQRWHMRVILGLIFAVTILGCHKEDDSQYYVKYEVHSSTIYTGSKLNVSITTESNNNTTLTVGTGAWETTMGPVKKGFEANFSVSEIGNNYGHLKLNAQISVSKNSSPFALKQIDNSDVPRTSVQINYAIDY